MVQFEGIRNFRDFGGYPARGGRLKRGRLNRSAHHADATDADLVATCVEAHYLNRRKWLAGCRGQAPA